MRAWSLLMVAEVSRDRQPCIVALPCDPSPSSVPSNSSPSPSAPGRPPCHGATKPALARGLHRSTSGSSWGQSCSYSWERSHSSSLLGRMPGPVAWPSPSPASAAWEPLGWLCRCGPAPWLRSTATCSWGAAGCAWQPGHFSLSELLPAPQLSPSPRGLRHNRHKPKSQNRQKRRAASREIQART